MQKLLKPGKNVLLAEVVNEGGPAGFVLKLALTMPTRRRATSSPMTPGRRPRKKDADTWVAARKIAKLGDAPWNDVFTRPSAVRYAVQRLSRAAGLPGRAAVHRAERQARLVGQHHLRQQGPAHRQRPGEARACAGSRRRRSAATEPTKVEHLDVKITAAQGLLFAFDSLYVSVNGGPGSGLYRVRDTNGDDQFDEVDEAAVDRAAAASTARTLCGCRPTASRSSSSPATTRTCRRSSTPAACRRTGAKTCCCRASGTPTAMPAASLAPGGWIANTDPDGKNWEIVSVGYRNAYDMALNADGELFAYDADMEWDMGMPWYRPTRVVHATSGSEFGWRSGTGKWPTYYVDSLPPMVDIGPGSPVGVAFGYGTKFPAKYQKALFCCDWTFGTIYALHLEPDGSTYKAAKEEFLSRTPLPLTDVRRRARRSAVLHHRRPRHPVGAVPRHLRRQGIDRRRWISRSAAAPSCGRCGTSSKRITRPAAEPGEGGRVHLSAPGARRPLHSLCRPRGAGAPEPASSGKTASWPRRTPRR